MAQDLFDVVVRVCNHQGNVLFLYYPKAGVIEVKRNKIFAQLTVSGLLEKGTRAIAQSGGEALTVSIPEHVELTDK